MDGAGLSDRERRALSAIEDHLKHDRSLDRLMRFTRLRHRVMAASVLGALTVALLVAASVTVSLPLIWGFAAAWTLTVVTALPLVGDWARRRWQRREQVSRP
ncbi:DUF3040 domain-containing protein [Streptomyces sp. NPDC046876]|uniref:DUF3040 domain-containing protein n=1 Tax=Streptomyces sp. NPDC046876 TaxID=3155616 RepID=UPI0033D60274